MAEKNGVAERVAGAFEKELKGQGWKKTYPNSGVVDKAYFKKNFDRIEKDGMIYIYSGMRLEIGPDGVANPNYDSVATPLNHDVEILQCMQRAEELVKQNG